MSKVEAKSKTTAYTKYGHYCVKEVGYKDIDIREGMTLWMYLSRRQLTTDTGPTTFIL